MCYHLHYLHFYFVFVSHYEALKRIIIFLLVKLIIVLSIHHYLGGVIGDSQSNYPQLKKEVLESKYSQPVIWSYLLFWLFVTELSARLQPPLIVHVSILFSETSGSIIRSFIYNIIATPFDWTKDKIKVMFY
jgi:hypothetical protein